MRDAGNKHGEQDQERSRCNVGSLCGVRERCLHPKTIDTEVESRLALQSDKRMLSRSDFLSPTKPLYGSGFSQKMWKPPISPPRMTSSAPVQPKIRVRLWNRLLATRSTRLRSGFSA